MAHETDGVQEPHDAPAPAITPLLPTAEKSEIIRHVFLPPHLGQAMDASASDIARRASKQVSQSRHLYSYSGIALASCSTFSVLQVIVPSFGLTVKAARYAMSPNVRRQVHLVNGVRKN